MEQDWVFNPNTEIIACHGAKQVYLRKACDESHKILMLGICGSGEVMKTLIILEKSFPLVGEGESDHILQTCQ